MNKWQKHGISSIIAVTMIGTATTGMGITVSADSAEYSEIQQKVNVTEEKSVSGGSEREESSEVEVHAPNKAPKHLKKITKIEEPADEEKGSITVANAVTVDGMLGALAATDGSDQTYEVTGEDGQAKEGESELATGDQLIVTAEDGTQATYTIFVEESKSSEVKVHAPNKAPKHKKIVLAIDRPTEDGEEGSITVANGKTVDQMLGALAATDGSNQTYEVTGKKGKVKKGDSKLATDDQLIVTAEDGTQATYTIIEKESSEVKVHAPNKAPKHKKIVLAIDRPTEDGEEGSITVANGKTVDQMLGALAATDGSNQTYEVTGKKGKVKKGDSKLATDDQLIVTAEDGTQATYTIIEKESSEVRVHAPNKAPKHKKIVLAIDRPTEDGEEGSITVANGKTVDQMLGALAATDGSNQTYEVTGKKGKVKKGDSKLATDDQLIVTAEDGTRATYTIFVEESSEVKVKAPNKAPEHLEIIKAIEEPTDEEKGSITVANATKVKEMLGALTATDGSEQTYEVTGENGKGKGAGNELVTGDQLVVTAEDGTQATYTIIEEPAQ